jgi:phage tail sheath protein FI
VTYPGVYVEETTTGHAIAGVATSVTAFLGRAVSGPVNDPVPVTSFGAFERVFGVLGQTCPMGYAVRDFFLNGGTDALVVRIYKDPAGSTGGPEGAPLDQAAYEGSRAGKTGLFALEKAGLFNLLCIPPDTRAGTTMPAVYRSALTYCATRRAMLLVDPPAHWDSTADARDGLAGDIGLTGSEARNAVLYFPRLVQPDPLDGQPGIFAPSGAVAGVMARTDAQQGVWKAPAGTDASLIGATDLAVRLSDTENGVLNPHGINTLRAFPGSGPVVWGARTLRGADQHADDYKYIPVRRLALHIEESLERGTQWAVFEPNDEPLWSEIRLRASAFMHELFTRGAFQGRTPREAYFVKAGRDTMTQGDIDAGVLNIEVGFAPLKPAEFVIIRIRQMVEAARPREDRPPPLLVKFNGRQLGLVAGWRELVLPHAELRQLRDLAEEVRRAGRDGRVGALFAGGSSTGRTLAAEVLANHLGLDLYSVDLSAIVSRYVGETEKNLGRLFDAAEAGGAILYLDEADALFGKRTDVRDSHDRYANVETGHLLQRIEAYAGLLIVATNRKSALDEAFIRRLRFVVDFQPQERAGNHTSS